MENRRKLAVFNADLIDARARGEIAAGTITSVVAVARVAVTVAVAIFLPGIKDAGAVVDSVTDTVVIVVPVRRVGLTRFAHTVAITIFLAGVRDIGTVVGDVTDPIVIVVAAYA